VTVVDGDPQPLKPTSKEGPAQLVNLNPYDTVRAATMAIQAGVVVAGEGDTIVAGIEDGDWTGIKGVDFGDGASEIAVTVSISGETSVEIHAGSPDGELLGTIAIAKTDGTPETYKTAVTGAKGVMDIYFVFRGGMKFETWQAYK
ncbi:MAG: carbohydrate-binding protein, partial [Agathobacter sp.]|nr:carbohydrate-binding protein [Agathobacter sp.]